MLAIAIHLEPHFRNLRIILDMSYCHMSYLSSDIHITYLFIQEMLFEHRHCSRFFTYTSKTLIKVHQTFCYSICIPVPSFFSLIQYMHHTASFITQMPCAPMAFFTDLISKNLVHAISYGLCGYAINKTAFFFF